LTYKGNCNQIKRTLKASGYQNQFNVTQPAKGITIVEWQSIKWYMDTVQQSFSYIFKIWKHLIYPNRAVMQIEPETVLHKMEHYFIFFNSCRIYFHLGSCLYLLNVHFILHGIFIYCMVLHWLFHKHYL